MMICPFAGSYWRLGVRVHQLVPSPLLDGAIRGAIMPVFFLIDKNRMEVVDAQGEHEAKSNDSSIRWRMMQTCFIF